MTGQMRTRTTSPRWRTALRAAALAASLAVVVGAPLAAEAAPWHGGGGHGGGAWHGGGWHGGWGGHPYWHGGYWGPRYGYAPAYGYYGYPYVAAPGLTVTIP
jgi:hypothetical protein